MILSYFSDTHLRSNRPSCRIDEDYYALQLRKFEEAMRLSSESDVSLHGGDFLHVHTPPLDLLSDVMRILQFKGFKPLSVNPGNHDLFGATTDTLDRCGLGVLDASGYLKILHSYEQLLWSGQFKIILRSLPYQVQYPEEFYHFEAKSPDCVYIILAHDMLTTRFVPFPHKDIHTLKTNADVVLCSHWHSQFTERVGNTLFVNSGPLDAQTVVEKHIKPALVSLDIKAPDNISMQFKFLTTTGYERIAVSDEVQQDLGLADDFIQTLKISNVADGNDLQQLIETIAKEQGHSLGTVSRALNRVKEMQTCMGA